MKKNIFYLLFSLLFSVSMTQAQNIYWGSRTVSEIVDKSDLVFEGRVIVDSPFFQNPPGHVYTRHKVIVLKQFKGIFTSDTIIVITNGGRMIMKGQWEGGPAYAAKSDEAVFLVTNSHKVEFGGNDPNAFEPFYGPGVSYITVCDKKNVVKEVYEPIEAVTGHPYMDVHPNNCATQKKK